MGSSYQEAKIARRRAKNREAQRRHREATKAKLTELERLKPQVDSRNTFLSSSPDQAVYTPHTCTSKTKTSPWPQFCGRCGNDHGGLTYAQSFALPSSHCQQTNFHNAAASPRGLSENPSEPPPVGLNFQEIDFALPTDEESLVLDSHQWYSIGDSSLPPNTSSDYIGTTASTIHGLSRYPRAKSTLQNQPYSRSKPPPSLINPLYIWLQRRGI